MATYNFTSNANIPWSTLAVGDVLNCNRAGTEITLTCATTAPVTFAIVADGGKGGNTTQTMYGVSTSGAYGNRLTATLTVQPNSALKLMRAENGGNNSCYYTEEPTTSGSVAGYGGGRNWINSDGIWQGMFGGGGGASYLYVDNTLILVAAGGGGGVEQGNSYDGNTVGGIGYVGRFNGLPASTTLSTNRRLSTGSAGGGGGSVGGYGNQRAAQPYVDTAVLQDVSVGMNSSTTTVFSLTVLSIGGGKTARVNVGGEWKEATPWVNVGGSWKKATPWVKVNGIWQKTTV